MNTKEELLQARAKYEAANVETSSLVRQLHTLQLQLHSAQTGDTDFDSTPIKEKLVRRFSGCNVNQCIFIKKQQQLNPGWGNSYNLKRQLGS